MLKKVSSLMALCAAIVISACSSEPTVSPEELEDAIEDLL